MNKLPAKLPPESVTVIVDNREQMPWDLSPLLMTSGTLQSGDYALRGPGLEDLIRIERKSLPDLVGVVGSGRERFARELERLRAFPVAVLIVEASWADIDAADWRSKVTAKAVRHSLNSWILRGLNVVLAGDRSRAQEIARDLLWRAADHRYREMKTLAGGLNLIAAGAKENA